MGKLLERVVSARIIGHLTHVGPNLSDEQYGFRAGRSTIDALLRLKNITQDAIARGERALAVSLDIANAFNSLPYACIDEALRYHSVPLYLRRFVEHYLRDRDVLFLDKDGQVCARRMTTGVPQGSVMGPLLWNIGYDWVLRGSLLPRTHVICYADDTLFIARGRSYEEVAHLASVGSTLLVSRIELLGLKVALEKTEALMFYGRVGKPPTGAYIKVGGVRIMLSTRMKYLGLTLDRAWQFATHFQLLAPKIQSAAGSLARLLPNLGGPRAHCRRLFTGVIRSMALYGAPVWADALTVKNKTLLRRPQRLMAIRAIRGYRTISYGAACTLASSLPWDREAKVLARVYNHKKEKQAEGHRLAFQEIQHEREQATEVAVQEWVEELGSARYGRRTTDAISPMLDEWIHREHGALTFRLVQVLTGHGCFGRYLHNVAKREATPSCHHCDATEDTAQHTLEECSAWSSQRQALRAIIGEDLSLPCVVKAMLDIDRAWKAMVSFCEEVISQKEAAERIREDSPQAEPLRRRRTGRRRRQFLHLLPLNGDQPGDGVRRTSPALHRSLTDVPHTQGHDSLPQGETRRIRPRRMITDRVAVESDREPATLSSASAPSSESSGDEWFDDALALR